MMNKKAIGLGVSIVNYPENPFYRKAVFTGLKFLILKTTYLKGFDDKPFFLENSTTKVVGSASE